MRAEVTSLKEARRARQIQYMARAAEAVIAGEIVNCTVQRVAEVSENTRWIIDYTIAKPALRSPYNLRRAYR